MSMPQEQNRPPQNVLICLVVGLLFIAAVPGIGWLWGQLVETIVLVIGGAFLVYAALAFISDISNRVAAIERRLAEMDRPRR